MQTYLRHITRWHRRQSLKFGPGAAICQDGVKCARLMGLYEHACSYCIRLGRTTIDFHAHKRSSHWSCFFRRRGLITPQININFLSYAVRLPRLIRIYFIAMFWLNLYHGENINPPYISIILLTNKCPYWGCLRRVITSNYYWILLKGKSSHSIKQQCFLAKGSLQRLCQIFKMLLEISSCK